MIKALLIAPNVDATDVGEALMAFKWAEALSARSELTVLCFQRPGRPDVSVQLPRARVVCWPEPAWAMSHERLNAMMKPAWPVFASHVRNWIAAARRRGDGFDIAHQLMPQAARYSSPLRHFDIPYIIGPLGGALDTPPAFRDEVGNAPLFTRLRALDAYRFRHDPWLRQSYARASCILGVAPYVRSVLQDMPMQRFESVLELGADGVAPRRRRNATPGSLRVLHVGRAVRTKGLRDVVRALGHLRDLPGISLTSAGAGEDLEACKLEAQRLGIADRVRFLGPVPRAQVAALYASHDVFCFPSFREPAGGVIYEAMSHGLPVVTADRGGPGWIVDGASGIRVPVTDPVTYAHDIASALRDLAASPPLRDRLGAGACAKIQREGLWSVKADRLVELYSDIVGYRTLPASIRSGRQECSK